MAEPRDPVAMLLEMALLLQRLSNGLVRDSDGLLRALFDDIAAQLVVLSPVDVQPRYRRDRIDKLVKRVAELAGETFSEWHRDTRNALAVVGKRAGEDAAHLLVATLGEEGRGLVTFAGPSQNTVRAALDVNPFQGELLKDWAENLGADVVRRVRQQVQLGVVREEPIDAIIRRVRGKSDGKGGFVGGVLQISRRDAETVVRTAVHAVAVDAQFTTYEGNPDVSDTWTWLSAFDSRVCEQCLALAGKVFRYDDPKAPRPPIHHRDRCVPVPNVDWESLGISPPDPGTRAARRPTLDSKGRVVDGKTVQIPAGTSADSWFRSLPAGVQDHMLGPGKAKLYRAGEITLGDLIGQDRKIVTLSDLQRRAA